MGLGGYYGWLLWGTGIGTARAQDDLRARLAERILDPRTDPLTAPPDATPGPGATPSPGGGQTPGTPAPSPRPPADVTFQRGDPVAIIRIPRIGLDMVVVEGTSGTDLTRGPGHYVNTAFPWEDSGRVGIAGHRTTYGRPFWSLNELEPGDRIVLETEFGTYRYRVTKSGVYRPTDDWALDQTSRPTLVLTTCHPLFSASHRLFVFAERE